MSWYRWLLCALCLALADGASLYLLLGLAAFVAGAAHTTVAPVGLAAVAGVLVLGVVATALRDIAPASWRGVGAAWLACAVAVPWALTARAAGGFGVEAGALWPLQLVTGGFGARDAAALLTVALVLVWLWRHGARRARGEAGAPRIARSFRAGLVVLVLVLALEAAGSIDLGTRAALVPFFAVSLAGMAIARAPAHGSRTRAWVTMTAASVVIVLCGGVVLGLVLVVTVRGGVGALWALWLELASAATDAVSATLSALLGSEPSAGLGLHAPSLQPPDWLVLLTLLAGAAFVGWAAHRIMGAPAAEKFRIVLDLGDEEREPVDRGDRHAVERLVDAVMPRWWRRRRPSRRPASAQPAGIVEIHHLYRRLLDLARSRGIAVNPAHTPFERARHLGGALPAPLVDALTRRFVAARYGAEPSSTEVIAELARELDAQARES